MRKDPADYSKRNPAEVTEVPWIATSRRQGDYPEVVYTGRVYDAMCPGEEYDLVIDSKTGECLDGVWELADKPSVPRSGKWLIFVHRHEVQAVWNSIKTATEEGKLGQASKVSTAYDAGYSPSQHVICVFTYDWTDSEDVLRVRKELRELGIVQPLPYKADEDTHSGKYSTTSASTISKYYA